METEGSVGGMLLGRWRTGGKGDPSRIILGWSYAVAARMLTDLEITETNCCQSVFPVGQISGRGAEDGKNRRHSLVNHMLMSFQGKQTGEDGGIVRQTTE